MTYQIITMAMGIALLMVIIHDSYHDNFIYAIGSDPGYNVTNTREIGVIHEIKVVKGGHLLVK